MTYVGIDGTACSGDDGACPPAPASTEASASYAGDVNHTGSGGQADFTITQASQAITWSNPANIVYGTALGDAAQRHGGRRGRWRGAGCLELFTAGRDHTRRRCEPALDGERRRDHRLPRGLQDRAHHRQPGRHDEQRLDLERSIVYSQSVTFTADVSTTVVGPGIAAPSGSVNFLDGTSVIGSGTESGGIATFSTTSLSVASHSITASYVGDANFSGSGSSAVTEVVNEDSTTTSVTSSANPSVYGQPVTFTATVTAAAPGTGTPSDGETVTFKNGSATLGTGLLSGGVATFTTSTPRPSRRIISLPSMRPTATSSPALRPS